MADSNSQKAATRAWTMFVPAIVVLFLYLIVLGAWGLPQGKELKQAASDLAAAQRAAVSPEEVARLTQRRKSLEADLKLAKEQLAARREKASSVAEAKTDPMKWIDINSQFHDCIVRHQIALISEGGRRNQNVDLARSLKDSSSDLLTAIKAASDPPASAGAAVPNLAMMEPEEFFARQQQGQGANTPVRVEAKNPILREVIVVANYENMTAALKEIARDCRETTVVSLELVRPSQRMVQTSARWWRLVLHDRPIISEETPRPSLPNNPQIAGGTSAARLP